MSSAFSRRGFFAGASGLVLAGCADVVGPPAAPKLYMLTPSLAAPPGGAKVSWALAIDNPEATSGLDTERIAITRPPSGLDYYADAAWADRLPALAEAVLLDALENTHRIASVSRVSEGTRADYVLSFDVREFFCRYDAGEGAPLAAVRLSARMIDARSRKIAGATVIGKEVRAAANSVPAGVAALTAAFGAVLADLVPWILDRPPPPA